MTKIDEEQIAELKDYFSKQMEIVLGAVNKVDKKADDIESEFSSYQRDNEKIINSQTLIEGQNKSIMNMFGRLTEKTVNGVAKAMDNVVSPAVEELTDKMNVMGDTKIGKPTEQKKKEWSTVRKVWSKISFWNKHSIISVK